MIIFMLQQVFEVCQKNEIVWLNCKVELVVVEQEYQEQVLVGDDCILGRMQILCDIIDVKKWEINQVVGCYICFYEVVQCISICNWLNDFMQVYGIELVVMFVLELMGFSQQFVFLIGYVFDCLVYYLCEVLFVWLSIGEEINYVVEDSDILMVIGFRFDVVLWVDNQEKYIFVQSLIYVCWCMELVSKQFCKKFLKILLFFLN